MFVFNFKFLSLKGGCLNCICQREADGILPTRMATNGLGLSNNYTT